MRAAQGSENIRSTFFGTKRAPKGRTATEWRVESPASINVSIFTQKLHRRSLDGVAAPPLHALDNSAAVLRPSLTLRRQGMQKGRNLKLALALCDHASPFLVKTDSPAPNVRLAALAGKAADRLKITSGGIGSICDGRGSR